jgi:hypothetical protein
MEKFMSEENTQEQQDPTQGEQPIEEPQQEEQPDVYDLSGQAAQLAEREASLTEMSQDLEKRLERVEQIEAKFQNMQKDPLSMMEEAGVTYEDLTSSYLDSLGDRTKTESEVILDKINMLESQVTEQASAQQHRDEELHKADQARKYNSAMGEISSFVGENSSKYELVNKMDAADLVLNVIGEHYSNTKEILDMDKACQAVEEYYEEEADRYLASEKIMSKFGIKKEDIQDGAQDNRPRTLTNNIGTKSPRYKDDQPVSRQESLDRASALLRWE